MTPISRLLLAVLALMLPVAAQASGDVALTGAVFVEKTIPEAGGKTRLVLEPTQKVVPGDRLVFVLNYKNQGVKPAADFVVTNPLPSAVAYQGTADAGATFSVDGGKSWGALSTLKVHKADGSIRAAYPEDVTHVRWAMKTPIPAGAAGKLSFRGVVR